jgi:hypothetical protein
MKKKICCLILCVMTTSAMYSFKGKYNVNEYLTFQFDDNEDPPTEDPPPPAPINQWIPILMLSGIVFIGYKVAVSKSKYDFPPKK